MDQLPVTGIPPATFLTFCSGILLIGTILYAYIFWYSRKSLYLSIGMMGLLGFLYTGVEASVIISGISGHPQTGMQLHRIQAITAASFIVALPYYIMHLLHLTPVLKKVSRWLIIFGLMIFAGLAVSAYLIPEMFLLPAKTPGTLITPWNSGRGTPGILYRARDLLIFTVSVWSVIMMLIEIKLHRRYAYILLSFAGALMAIAAGVYDLYLAAHEMNVGLFTTRVFSYFSIGLTLFILLSMIGVMKWFIDQTRLVERAERLESLGLMAGGIAHDFNNLLTGIIGNASLAREKTSAPDEQQTLLSGIENAAARAKNLAYQLLTFAKGGAPIKNIVSVSDIIRETADFILRGSNVRAMIDIGDDIWDAPVDANQISQVAQNLIINAREAMPHGGEIEIRISNIRLNGATARLKTGDYIQICIKDSGTGIPVNKIPFIFDPYFSTKENGSGLGLSITHSIITQHNGTIDAQSSPGEGTLFTIMLPAEREHHIENRSRPELPAKFTGRALILDDETMIRDLLEAMLDEIGLRAVKASSSSEAVRLYRDSLSEGKPFEVVIMDLTIPGGIGGKETISLLKEMHPDVKAIVSSGYSESGIMSEYHRYGFSAALPKPYTFSDLKHTVSQVLSEKHYYSGSRIT